MFATAFVLAMASISAPSARDSSIVLLPCGALDAAVPESALRECNRMVRAAAGAAGAPLVRPPLAFYKRACDRACALRLLEPVAARGLQAGLDSSSLTLSLFDTRDGSVLRERKLAFRGGSVPAELGSALAQLCAGTPAPTRVASSSANPSPPFAEDLAHTSLPPPAGEVEVSVEGESSPGTMKRLVDEVLADTQQLSGRQLKGKIQVNVLGDRAFAAAFAQSSTSKSREVVRRLWRTWAEFGFVPMPPVADPAASGDDRSLLGFYDPARKALFVRREQAGSRAADREEELRSVLAHEIEHALQDANFRLPDLAAMADDDQRLAVKSLLEGEAMYVEMTYRARRQHLAVRGAVAAFAQAVHDESLQGLLRTEASGDPLQLPRLLQDYLALQYVHGLAYVEKLHRVGGKTAVDSALRNPPASSRAVLLASLEPLDAISLPPPAAPAGADVLWSGTLGPIPARAFFAQCGDEAGAGKLAMALAADAYTIARSPDGRVTVLWRATFDKAELAAAAAERLSGRACGKAVPDVAVRLDGSSLAYSRGAPAPLMVAAIATAPRRDAGSYRTLDQRPVVINGSFVSPSLGIKASFLPGLQINRDRDDVEFDVYGGAGGVIAKIVDEPATDESMRQHLMGVAVESQREHHAEGGLIQPMTIRLLGADRPAISMTMDSSQYDGQGRETVAGMGYGIHAVCVPLCEGRKFVEIILESRGRGSGAADAYLTEFLKTMQWSSSPGTCASP